MNLPAPIRFGLWVLSGMTPAKADLRRAEQMAAMHLWPTTGRSVMGAPTKRPAAAETAPATSQGDEILEPATD